MGWSWALDNYGGRTLVDPRILQTTANILNRFVANPQSDFTIAASPSSQTVTEGGGTSYSVTISPTGGFTGQVTLSVSGLPSGATGGFTPNPATASSTLSVTTSTSTLAGAYTLTIAGVNGSLTHTTTVALVVNSLPPTAPSSLTATALSSSQINLAWIAASGAVTNYQVERCQTTACSFAPIATVSGTTYSDTTGLAASTSYTYRVQASGPGGSSPYSNTASATTLPPPPTAPSSLTAAAASSSQINLAWTAASGAVTTYLVERCQGTPCTFTQVGTSTTTAYSDTGLSASTSYSYRVQASGPGGSSPYSNTASATTLPPPPPAPSSLTPTAAISTLTLHAAPPTSCGATTSLLDERHQPSPSTFAQVGTSTTAAYSDTGLFASTSYTYRVRASGPGGSSAYSNTASATTGNFVDVTAPILSLPANITTTATNLLGATVTFKVSPTDNVDPTPTVRCSPPSGSIFHIGITTVTCTATDRAGNVGSGSFLVTVLRL